MLSFPQLYQNLFFLPLDTLRGRKTIRRLRELRKSQYWKREDLERWQLEKMNSLLAQARTNSPHFASALQSLRLPLRSLEELSRVPVLKKEQIRESLESIRCANIPMSRCMLSKTGGSTGEPTWYYLDKAGADWNRGTVYRSAEWADVHLGERTMQMMGSHYDMKEFDSLKWKIVFALQRYMDCSVAKVNDEIFDRYYHKMCRFRPTSIWGYASGIYLFSLFIEKHHPGARLDFVKALITSSETLWPSQREKIEVVFGKGKVFDHYGSREVYIASECPQHRGYHIHAEVILVEVVDEQGNPRRPGELGRILITDLSNHAFPFIRYDIGDVGVLADRRDCPCGRTLPLLEKIEGRVADMVVLRDRILTPPNFTILMSDLTGVNGYQFVQEKMDALTVNIVKGDAYTPQTETYIRYALGQLCGDIRIEIQHVDTIPVPASGKRRYIISHVAARHL